MGYVRRAAGWGVSTDLPDFDFETYSEADLPEVGAALYAMHPSTEILSLAYNLKDGKGERLWTPGQPAPLDLLQHIAQGGLIEAWNVGFEWWIWKCVGQRLYPWPPLAVEQCRCAMAKARAWSLPGALAKAGKVVQGMPHLLTPAWPPLVLKDPGGDALLKKFSKPRKPTKLDARTRHKPEDFPLEAMRLYAYNLTDIASEQSIAVRVPDLQPDELDFYIQHERINRRGIQVNVAAVHNAIAIIEQAYAKYNPEIATLTGGAVTEVTQASALLQWFNLTMGSGRTSMDDDAITEVLAQEGLPPHVRRVLTIRQAIGGAAVKKLYSLRKRVLPNGRVVDLIVYHNARTGRSAGEGPQPHNFPKGGPEYRVCDPLAGCGGYYAASHKHCPHCGNSEAYSTLHKDWTREAAGAAIGHMVYRSLEYMERVWGEVFDVVAGCLRSMFVAAPGHDLIVCDYNAIEAVVLAALAGEEWRLDVFRSHGKIYEMSASKITGIPFDEYAAYKARTGSHHPTRNAIGKVAELACLRGDSLVLTDKGWVQIRHVTLDHLLWDGEDMVPHAGLKISERKEPYSLVDGLWITENHQCLVEGDKWATARLLNCDHRAQYLALETGALMRPPGVTNWVAGYSDRFRNDVVYDILECGPNNRFMVKTRHGFLIVHNSGYQGWVGAWKAFGADEHFANDDEIAEKVKAWRAASPNIVKLWYKVQDCAVSAISNPGVRYSYRQLSFYVSNDALYMVLPSGRHLTYHAPRLQQGQRGPEITYETWNSNPKYGPIGWVRLSTFGGRLVENATQAVSADILRPAIRKAERRGYNVVIHVHDEIVAEVPEGWGSVEELEAIMTDVPEWAKGWPIRASGGWRGKWYGK